MANFLSNIAPGVGALSTGYLKGQAATEEKSRTEEMERDKTALAMYARLLESGHFKPVDPKRGVVDGQVLQIGNAGWLTPTKISEDPRYAESLQRQEFAREKQGWEKEEFSAKAGEAAEERGLRRELGQLSLQEMRERIAAIKEGKTKPDRVQGKVYIKDKDTGEIAGEIPWDEFGEFKKRMKADGLDPNQWVVGKPSTSKDNETTFPIYDESSGNILNEKVPKSELDATLARLRKTGFPKAMIGKPSPISERPVTPMNALEMDRKMINTRMGLIEKAKESKTSDEEGMEIASSLNKLAKDIDEVIYVWRPTGVLKPTTWFGTKLDPVKLPMVELDDGKMVRLTIGDVKRMAKRNKLTYEAQLNKLLNAK